MYSTCKPATKNKDKIQKFQETADSRYIYQKELDHASFHHDMAYENFKDSARRTASDKELSDKAFNTANNPKYDGYQRLIFAIFYKCFDDKPSGDPVRSKNVPNEQLTERLHKTIIIRKFG